MIDHVVLGVHHLDESRHFYEHALRPLGLKVVAERPEHGGLRRRQRAAVLLAGRCGSRRTGCTWRSPRPTGRRSTRSTPLRCTRAGWTTARPGLRPIYHEHYYAAFAFDADGNNIEAVCHRPGLIAKRSKIGETSALLLLGGTSVITSRR